MVNVTRSCFLYWDRTLLCPACTDVDIDITALRCYGSSYGLGCLMEAVGVRRHLLSGLQLECVHAGTQLAVLHLFSRFVTSGSRRLGIAERL